MGTIGIPIDQVMNWLGVQDPAVANRFLTSGGIPAIQLTQSDVVTHMELEHTWVSAFVDYVPSRVHVQQTSDTWVEIDPSFKQFERIDGIDLRQNVPFDTQQFLNEIISTGIVDENAGYATGFDQALILQRLDEHRLEFENFLQTQIPDATVGDILSTEAIIAQNLGIIPASLPYRVFVHGDATPVVPDAFRHKIRFQVGGLNFIDNVANLAGKRVTLSYITATDQDRQIIEANTDQTTLPAYLIKVKPVLRIDGAEAATGSPITLGTNQQFQLEFTKPFGGKDVTSTRAAAGGYYAVGLDIQTILPEHLDKIHSESESVKNRIATNPDTLFSAEETIGLLLQSVIIGFWAEGDLFEQIIGEMMKVHSFRPTPGVGFASLGIDVSTLYGIPMTYQIDGSMSLDVPRSVRAIHSATHDDSADRAFGAITTNIRSQLEASIFEILFPPDLDNPGVSTTQVLSFANAQNIPIYRIDQSNIFQILPQLQIVQAIKQDILNSVNAGKVVIIPQQEVSIGLWQGVGYIVQDPTNGNAAYLISGGLAGGKKPSILEECNVINWIKAGFNGATLIENLSNCVLAKLEISPDKAFEELKKCVIDKYVTGPRDPAVYLVSAQLQMASVIVPTLLSYFPPPAGYAGEFFEHFWSPVTTFAAYKFAMAFLCNS